MSPVNEKVRIWVVTPHESSEFDEWWGACVTDKDHDDALHYMQRRCEDLWDQYDSGRPTVERVTIEQRDVLASDFWKTLEIVDPS